MQVFFVQMFFADKLLKFLGNGNLKFLGLSFQTVSFLRSLLPLFFQSRKTLFLRVLHLIPNNILINGFKAMESILLLSNHFVSLLIQTA